MSNIKQALLELIALRCQQLAKGLEKNSLLCHEKWELEKEIKRLMDQAAVT